MLRQICVAYDDDEPARWGLELAALVARRASARLTIVHVMPPVDEGVDRREQLRRLREPWEKFRIDVEQIDELDDCVRAGIRFRARGIDSGVAVDMRFGMAIRVRDGLATELVNRRTGGEAGEALQRR